MKFTLFKDDPEFYAKYMMKNVKNNRVYSDKFILSVVDLNQIELATEEDKAHRIDYWARMFMARTWEDLRMLARENEYLKEAADSLYVANADEIVRQQCQAREDAERRERTLERDNKLLKEKLAEVISQKDEEISRKDELINQKEEELRKQAKKIEELKKQLAQRV